MSSFLVDQTILAKVEHTKDVFRSLGPKRNGALDWTGLICMRSSANSCIFRIKLKVSSTWRRWPWLARDRRIAYSEMQACVSIVDMCCPFLLSLPARGAWIAIRDGLRRLPYGTRRPLPCLVGPDGRGRVAGSCMPPFPPSFTNSSNGCLNSSPMERLRAPKYLSSSALLAMESSSKAGLVSFWRTGSTVSSMPILYETVNTQLKTTDDKIKLLRKSRSLQSSHAVVRWNVYY